MSGRIYTTSALPISYANNFAATQNPVDPINLLQGFTDAIDWTDMQSSGGVASETDFNAGFNDGAAVLRSSLYNIGPAQKSRGIVHRVGGYVPPSSHELELTVRGSMSAHSAKLYELDIQFPPTSLQVVRWNGPSNDFTVLTGGVGGSNDYVEGDAVEFSINSAYDMAATLDGISVFTITDTDVANRIANGMPGFGQFVRSGTGANLTSFAWDSILLSS